jgi:hypothetical protein
MFAQTVPTQPTNDLPSLPPDMGERLAETGSALMPLFIVGAFLLALGAAIMLARLVRSFRAAR